jgi:glycosyltransferase involved in cell wall biosynthesis
VHFLRFRYSIYKDLLDSIRDLQPDLIHLNNGLRSAPPVMVAARKLGVPTVCHVRTFSKLTHFNIAAARSVRKFICISNAVRNTIVNYGIDAERCIVVPNAVDTSTFKVSNRSPADIRQQLNCHDDEFVFALVGRVVSWKGHDYFIKAVAEARQSNGAITGLIVGDADPSESNTAYMNSLRSLIESLDVVENIIFTGHRTDIPDIMRSADAVVCASSEPEPFGRVIIESMAMETPVIATNAGGAPDIIEDNVTGLLVPVKDSHSMARAMLRFSDDDQLTDQIRAAGIETLHNRYGADKHASDISRIYQALSIDP